MGNNSKILLVLVLAVSSLFGFEIRADSPARDEKVAELRSLFKRSRKPLPEDLHYGKIWTCEYRSALKGSREHSIFQNYYQFEPTETPNVVLNRDGQAPVFRFSKRSLNGEYRNNGKPFGVEHVRVTDKGDLIVEFTLPECDLLTCLFFGLVHDRSVDNYWQALLGYRVCYVAN